MTYFEWSTLHDFYGHAPEYERFPFKYIDATSTVDPELNEVVYVITTVPERKAQQWRTNSPTPTVTPETMKQAWARYLQKSQQP